jgi:hypothetical protein
MVRNLADPQFFSASLKTLHFTGQRLPGVECMGKHLGFERVKVL